MRARVSYVLHDADGRTAGVACVDCDGGWTCCGQSYPTLEALTVMARQNDLELGPLCGWLDEELVASGSPQAQLRR